MKSRFILYLFSFIGLLLENLFAFAGLFLSGIRIRKTFEKRNSTRTLPSDRCPYWFHVSSEGELEQVYPLIKIALQTGKNTLLIFTSPSVEKKVHKLNDEYENLYISSYNFIYKQNIISKLKKPNVFIMVRYDFFPRLLSIANDPKVTSTLVNASLKNKEINIFSSIWLKSLYECFDNIFWANNKEKSTAHSLSLSGDHYSCDFRNERIILRQSQADFSQCAVIQEVLAKFNPQKRIILGSLWASTSNNIYNDLISLKKDGYLIFIAPHLLKGEDYKDICDQYSMFKNWNKLNDIKINLDKDGDIVLCHIPGILCELYSLFGHCYVDGGFGYSVHSLLEPFWGGGHVYCGPRHHRSTEIDMIKDMAPNHVHVMANIESFKSIIIEEKINLDDLSSLRETINIKTKEYKTLVRRLMEDI